jgi:hypothetical protein
MVEAGDDVAKRIRKCQVFVGSSVENLTIAYAIQDNLEPRDADVTVWRQGVFDVASYGLDSLLEATKSHDFGVFVFAPDDVTRIRGRKHGVVRDNVLFELGLFMGRLGRARTFVILPRKMDLHLPSDLAGWTTADYDPERKNLCAALGVACNQIRSAIAREGPFRPDSPTRLVRSAAVTIEMKPPFSPISIGGARKQTIRIRGSKATAKKQPKGQRFAGSHVGSKARPSKKTL